MYFVATARPVQIAGGHEIAARTGFRQLDDREESDEHHARHWHVGHAEVRIADVKKCEGEAGGSDECRRPPEESRPDAKEEPDADHASGSAQQRATVRCADVLGSDSPRRMFIRDNVTGTVRKANHSAAATARMNSGG